MWKELSIKAMFLVLLTSMCACYLALVIAEIPGVIAMLVGMAAASVLSKISMRKNDERERETV
jgi:CHASE2 domain-containing sensor protein